MKYDLRSFRRWLFCGLVYLFATVGLRAALSISGSQGSATVYAEVTAIVNQGGGSYLVTWSWNLVPDSGPPYTGVIASLGGSNKFATGGGAPVSGSGSVSLVAGTEAGTGKKYTNLTINTTAWSAAQVLKIYLDDPLCPDVPYDFYLSGDSIMGTRYVVITEPTSGTPAILAELTVGYGATEHVTGTATALCGTVKVQKNHPGDESPWQDYTPPPGPPGGPPQSPPPPDGLPTAPDSPTPPNAGGGTTPPTPPAPSTPPVGGGGGDGEIIEWVKDTNEVNRGISTRVDVSNEYLRQIRDNTEYAADRLETIDENTQVIADDVKRKEAAEQAIKDATPTSAQMTESGVAAGAAVTDAMGTLTYTIPEPSTSEPNWTMTIMGNTMNYNPFSIAEFNEAASWMRRVAAWVLAYLFFQWALREVSTGFRSLDMMPQTRGNTVFAGTGGQATAAIAAALITALVVSTAVVLYAMLRDSSFGTMTMVTIFGDSPFSGETGIVAEAIWVMEKIFPISTALAVMAGYLTFSFQVSVAVAVAMAIKRWIFP